ncbi:hypothetical protein B0H17DRAFT_1145790 [Mycena rosella]|uniref:Uncharacterized protein n=1 Tax=Mycena rosella TaxID=1033263 RepID=A0AAD7G5H3_MYCRO|nr:hypothetical protein B0H17DRAFT_1145790 [Mycena rosella]
MIITTWKDVARLLLGPYHREEGAEGISVIVASKSLCPPSAPSYAQSFEIPAFCDQNYFGGYVQPTPSFGYIPPPSSAPTFGYSEQLEFDFSFIDQLNSFPRGDAGAANDISPQFDLSTALENNAAAALSSPLSLPQLPPVPASSPAPRSPSPAPFPSDPKPTTMSKKRKTREEVDQANVIHTTRARKGAATVLRVPHTMCRTRQQCAADGACVPRLSAGREERGEANRGDSLWKVERRGLRLSHTKDSGVQVHVKGGWDERGGRMKTQTQRARNWVIPGKYDVLVDGEKIKYQNAGSKGKSGDAPPREGPGRSRKADAGSRADAQLGWTATAVETHAPWRKDTA